MTKNNCKNCNTCKHGVITKSKNLFNELVIKKSCNISNIDNICSVNGKLTLYKQGENIIINK